MKLHLERNLIFFIPGRKRGWGWGASQVHHSRSGLLCSDGKDQPKYELWGKCNRAPRDFLCLGSTGLILWSPSCHDSEHCKLSPVHTPGPTQTRTSSWESRSDHLNPLLLLNPVIQLLSDLYIFLKRLCYLIVIMYHLFPFLTFGVHFCVLRIFCSGNKFRK